MPTTATPVILTDPGYLFWAPLGTGIPANTVVGSKFTDAWPGGFISLGATEDGSEFNYESKLEPINAAEFFDPLRWSTTERSGSMAFNLMNYTLANMNIAFNGGTLTIVSGTGTTQLNRYRPPSPGAEVRSVIGWESLDSTMRIIIYQAIQGGAMKSNFKKAPSAASIPCTFQFEVPTSGIPFEFYTAGTSRA